MRKTLALTIAGILVSTTAFAGGQQQKNPQQPSPSSSAVSQAAASGIGVGIGHSQSLSIASGGKSSSSSRSSQQQDQSQSQSANNEGNHQSLNLSSSHRDRLQAPDVFAPAVYASHSCALGWSIGASGPGAGISGGKAKADPSCERREWSRLLWTMNPVLAMKVACSDPIVAEVAAPGDCEPVIKTEAEKVSSLEPLVPPPNYVTRDELDRVFRKAMEK